MSIADHGTLRSKVAAPWQRVCITKSAVYFPGGGVCSLWTAPPLAGAIPTSPEALTSAKVGAVDRVFDSAGTQRLAQTILGNSNGSSSGGGTLVLVDRLWHQGGLDSTSTLAQPLNTPPSILTRYTSGVGVIAALELYTAIGAAVTMATLSYTNQAGVSGRTSQPVALGGNGRSEALRLIPIPLATGDSGVRSVSNLTLGASTGGAGQFGVTLFKPLLAFPVFHYAQGTRVFDGVVEMFGQMPSITAGACLSWLYMSFQAFTGAFNAELKIVEE